MSKEQRTRNLDFLLTWLVMRRCCFHVPGHYPPPPRDWQLHPKDQLIIMSLYPQLSLSPSSSKALLSLSWCWHWVDMTTITLLSVFIRSWYWSAQLSYSAWACLMQGAWRRYSEKEVENTLKLVFTCVCVCICLCWCSPVWYWPTWQRSTITWDTNTEHRVLFYKRDYLTPFACFPWLPPFSPVWFLCRGCWSRLCARPPGIQLWNCRCT